MQNNRKATGNKFILLSRYATLVLARMATFPKFGLNIPFRNLRFIIGIILLRQKFPLRDKLDLRILGLLSRNTMRKLLEMTITYDRNGNTITRYTSLHRNLRIIARGSLRDHVFKIPCTRELFNRYNLITIRWLALCNRRKFKIQKYRMLHRTCMLSFIGSCIISLDALAIRTLRYRLLFYGIRQLLILRHWRPTFMDRFMAATCTVNVFRNRLISLRLKIIILRGNGWSAVLKRIASLICKFLLNRKRNIVIVITVRIVGLVTNLRNVKIIMK